MENTENNIESSKLGVKETKDLIIFLTKLGMSVAQCAIEKKFNVLHFIDDIQALPAALSGITEIPDEVRDLQSEEMRELMVCVLGELSDLNVENNEAAKKFINAGINFAEGIIDIISGIKELKN